MRLTYWIIWLSTKILVLGTIAAIIYSIAGSHVVGVLVGMQRKIWHVNPDRDDQVWMLVFWPAVTIGLLFGFWVTGVYKLILPLCKRAYFVGTKEVDLVTQKSENEALVVRKNYVEYQSYKSLFEE